VLLNEDDWKVDSCFTSPRGVAMKNSYCAYRCVMFN